MNIQNLINYASLLFQIQVKDFIPVLTSKSCWYGEGKTPCLKAVSNPKGKCFAAIGYVESVKITLVQYDSFLILSQFSISEI